MKELEFFGFKRPDGSVGVRNHILVLPTVICANQVALKVAEAIPEAIAIPHVCGCSYNLKDQELTKRTLIGAARNPNVAAVLVVSLGCETAPADEIANEIAQSGKPTELLVIQEEKGTPKAIEKGIRILRKFHKITAKQLREPCPINSLIVGTECGASDAFSGLSANPALGLASDLLVESGATVILSETNEMLGAEHFLIARAADAETRKKIQEIVQRAEEGLSVGSGGAKIEYITPGNIAGGLTTIEEKSLGCIYKGGTTRVQEVIEYAQKPKKKGLVIMDTPGQDIESITGMVAGGAQIICFTTGRGSPAGCAIAPVIKISSNTAVYSRMKDNIDINAGTIIEGRKTIDQVGREIFQEILKVASGKLTKSEKLEHREFSICRGVIAGV